MLNSFELATAFAIGLFGLSLGAALATVLGVLVELQVMLSLVIALRNSLCRGSRASAPRLLVRPRVPTNLLLRPTRCHQRWKKMRQNPLRLDQGTRHPAVISIPFEALLGIDFRNGSLPDNRSRTHDAFA